MSESDVQQMIQLEGPTHGCVLMRNNSGALPDRDGRIIRYGLNNISEKQNAVSKSSDLIGVTTITITSEMVGKTIGVITAVEVKKSDWKWKGDKREIAQRNFIEWIKLRGGFAGFARSVEEFREIIKL